MVGAQLLPAKLQLPDSRRLTSRSAGEALAAGAEGQRVGSIIQLPDFLKLFAGFQIPDLDTEIGGAGGEDGLVRMPGENGDRPVVRAELLQHLQRGAIADAHDFVGVGFCETTAARRHGERLHVGGVRRGSIDSAGCCVPNDDLLLGTRLVAWRVGRNETLRDAKTLQEANRAYEESGGSFRELVISLMISDSFLFRAPEL